MKLSLQEFRAFFREIPDPAWAPMERFAELLSDQGRRAGLIGFEPSEIPEQIARSLLIARLWGSPKLAIDLGSGAGLPGLPLAISGAPVTLVEPRQRAQAFLELVLRSLGVDVALVPTTAEEAGKGPMRETADVVMARALARPSIALELCTPLCRPGGIVILTAGPSATPIEGDWLNELGLGESKVVKLDGPEDIHQLFHIVQKIRPVSDAFPRKQGQAQRKPLF